MALLWRDQSANRSSVAPFFQLAEEKEREKKKATERKNQISHWCDMFRQRRKELGKGERSILAILQRIWEEDRGKRGRKKKKKKCQEKSCIYVRQSTQIVDHARTSIWCSALSLCDKRTYRSVVEGTRTWYKRTLEETSQPASQP